MAIAGWGFISHSNHHRLRNAVEPVPQFLMESTWVDGDVAIAARAVRAGVDVLGKRLIRSWLFEMMMLGCTTVPPIAEVDPDYELQLFKRMTHCRDGYKPPVSRDWDAQERAPEGAVSLPATTIPLHLAIAIASRSTSWRCAHSSTASYLVLSGLSEVVDGAYRVVNPKDLRLRR